MSRETNVEIFKDTERTVRENKTLLKSVENTIKKQKLYPAGSAIILEKGNVQNTKIIVSGKRTLEAASSYKGKKVCIMNFASATNPGGGVERGSNAQEEALCRISTLYFCLNTPDMRKCFYMPHRKARNPLYNDDIIYSPDVCVIKNDSAKAEMLAEEDWYKVNVSYSGKNKTGYVLGNYIDVDFPEKAKKTEEAKEAFVNDKITSFLNVRKEASTTSGVVAKLPKGTVVLVTGSSGNWYKISTTYDSKDIKGYVAKEYITFGKPEEAADNKKDNNVPVTDEDFDTQLAAFPDSYKEAIKALRASYPNWNFVAVNTGLDWNTAVANESVVGRNLIQSNYPKGVASLAPLCYLSTAEGAYDSTKKKYTVFDGYNWYSAAPEVIAYYMDPRNFLNDTDIFQFEALAYDESQSSTVVESILKDTFMSGDYSVIDPATGQAVTGSYVQAFMEAGKASGANPYFLAARCKQEVGAKGSIATSGTYEGYEGIYNYYNIGASDGSNAVVKGLLWAKGGQAGATTYNRPWTTPYKSIIGGASYIAQNYIAKGQNTLYFQKFNVHPIDAKQTYSHQYMTNVQAPWAEGRTTRAAYNALGILSDTMVFYIPVYNNMPETISALPVAE